MEVTLRTYDPKTDNGYIYSTWTKFDYYSPIEPILVAKNIWFQEKIKQIDKLLEEGFTQIACLKDDPYTIVGYSVHKQGVMQKICIKSNFRNQGIEELLTKKREAKHGREEIAPQPSENDLPRDPGIQS